MEKENRNPGILREDFGSGPAVLVLHQDEGSRLLETFAPLAEAGYRVILARLLDPETEAREVIELLDALGIGRAVMLGIGPCGSVLLDLLERHPGRVAAGSFVVSKAQAKEMRRRAGAPEMREALSRGRIEGLREALLAACPLGESGGSRLENLRAWAEGVCRRTPGRCDLRTRLSGLRLPPLLEEQEETAPSRRRAWRPLRALNGHLALLIEVLLPREEGAEEEDILVDPA